MRSVVPIANLQRRIPEAGRIRTGEKAGKAMKALSTFRFTSHDEEALSQVAGLYGGTVRPWSDPKAAPGQFEVVTQATEIRVVLPPDPLGGSPIYELWSGGGCQRRCDGVQATVLQQGPDGLEPNTVPCMCAAAGEMACKVITRLNVILPEVRFVGVWRLDTKSWNAAQEMPGMVDMIQGLQATGLQHAVLALKQRRSVDRGETHKFIVPMLGIPDTVEALVAGQNRLDALPSAEVERPALAPAPDDTPAIEAADGDVVDAELVDEPTDIVTVESLKARAAFVGVAYAALMREAQTIAGKLGKDAPGHLSFVIEDADLLRGVQAFLAAREEAA